MINSPEDVKHVCDRVIVAGILHNFDIEHSVWYYAECDPEEIQVAYEEALSIRPGNIKKQVGLNRREYLADQFLNA